MRIWPAPEWRRRPRTDVSCVCPSRGVEECMARYGVNELRGMVEPDRVHRSTYSDPDIFEIEMERIFNRVWTYVGHESQVKKPGDYWTVTIGRQPMIMIRGEDGKVHVLYNR